MSNKFNTLFFNTSDSEKICFNINFKLDDYDPKKPLMFFNYGLVCSYYHWENQIQYFHKKGYQVLYHDYRGHFKSTGKKNIEKITINRIAMDMLELTSKFNFKNIIMLGHSMGVNTSLEYAKMAQQRLSSLVLLSGTVLPTKDYMLNSNIMGLLTPCIEEIFNHHPTVLNKLWEYNYLNPIMRKIILLGGFNPETVSDEFVQKYLKKVGELGPEIFFQLFNELSDHEILMYLEDIKTPSLIIAGENDKVIPYSVQVIITNLLPNSQLVSIRNGSHVPQIDFPGLINKKIEKYMKGSFRSLNTDRV